MSIPGVIIAITIHEWVKCMTMYRLGDTGVKAQGRLVPNPLKHMDALGFIFMLFFSYGWANPARVSMFRLKGGKRDMVIVFLMPFLANIVFAAALAFGARVLWLNFNLAFVRDYEWILTLFQIMVRASALNIGFAFFNLLPIYPLNGINLVTAFNPMLAVKINQREKMIQMILALLIIMGLAAAVFNPVVGTVMGWLMMTL